MPYCTQGDLYEYQQIVTRTSFVLVLLMASNQDSEGSGIQRTGIWNKCWVQKFLVWAVLPRLEMIMLWKRWNNVEWWADVRTVSWKALICCSWRKMARSLRIVFFWTNLTPLSNFRHVWPLAKLFGICPLGSAPHHMTPELYISVASSKSVSRVSVGLTSGRCRTCNISAPLSLALRCTYSAPCCAAPTPGARFRNSFAWRLDTPEVAQRG